MQEARFLHLSFDTMTENVKPQGRPVLTERIISTLRNANDDKSSVNINNLFIDPGCD